jgi:hypothetical protein
MLSFIRRVLDRCQLEARGRLSCGVDELLEEGDLWSEESERFGLVGKKGVLFHLLQRGYRSFVNEGKFPGQTTQWGGGGGGIGDARRSGTRWQRVDFSVHGYVLTTICPGAVCRTVRTLYETQANRTGQRLSHPQVLPNDRT